MTDGLDFDQILDVCLTRLRDGDTLDACLASYPTHAERLAPVLRAASMLQTPTRVTMSAEGFRAGEARLLAHAAQLHAQQQRTLPVRQKGGVSCLLASMRRLIAATVVAMSLFCVALSAGVVAVSAASTSLPGSLLYPVKRTTENLLSSAAFTPRLQTRVHLAWAQRRLGEIRTLVTRDGIANETVVAALEHETEQALIAAEQAGAESLTAVVTHTDRQRTVLTQLLDQAPEAARPELERALEASTQVNERARSALDGIAPDRPNASPAPHATPQLPQLTGTPQPPKLSETPRPKQTSALPATSQPQETSQLSETAEPTDLSKPPETPLKPAETSESIEPTETVSSPEATASPELLELTETPQPPKPTETPEAIEPTEVPELLEPTETTEPPEPTKTPKPPKPTQASAATKEPTADAWDKSSLRFVNQGSNCEGGGTVWANVRNVGDEAMAAPTNWELWYAASGSPKSGEIIAIGEIPGLDAGQEYLISDAATEGSGNYMFKAYQRPGHPGTGVLGSDAIVFDANQCSD